MLNSLNLLEVLRYRIKVKFMSFLLWVRISINLVWLKI